MKPLSPELNAALRGLRRSPAFTLATVSVLAGASGATTAILALANALLLRPLPVVEQDRVAIAWKEDYKAGFVHYPFTWRSVVALKPQLTTAEAVATIDYNGAWPLSTAQGDRGYRLPVGMVSGNLFPLLGVEAVAGRLFVPADDVAGGRRVIVISESYWRTRYQSDPAALGQSLPVLGIPHEIIGVVPEDFAYPRGAVAWIPMLTWAAEWYNSPDAVTQDIVVRLKPGRTLAQFRAELEAARARTPEEQWNEFATHRVVVRSWAEEVTGSLRSPLLLLGLGAAIVLVVACANVGALLLVRVGGRAQELAVRVALGGNWASILRAALLEHMLLVSAGTMAGLAVAALSLGVIEPRLPEDLGRVGTLSLGLVPALLGVLLGLMLGIAGGIGPALVFLRARLTETLRLGGHPAGARWGTHPLRRALVAGQTLLAVVAVSSASLLMRSLKHLEQIEVGFEAEHLLFVDLTISAPIPGTAAGRNWVDRMVGEVARVPGVLSVAANFSPPFVGNAGGYTKLRAEGQAEIPELPLANWEPVTPGYFETMGTRLLRGRPILPSDNETAPAVVVINQRLANFLWPGQDPVGRRVTYASDSIPRWMTVVGVIADTRYNELRTPVPSLWIPYRQTELVPPYLLVRTRPEIRPGTLDETLRRAVTTADASTSMISATPMRALLGKPLTPVRVITLLTSAFGLIALTLAAVGLYGVLSSLVLQRRREIGIRMALGADARSVQALIGKQAVLVVIAGLLGGLGISLLGRWVTPFLYGVTPTDPLTFGAVIASVAFAGALAVLAPVRRATRIDPAETLRDS